MNLFFLIVIEIIFLILIGMVVYVVGKQGNFMLSYSLNKVFLVLLGIELTVLIYAFQYDSNTCTFAKNVFC
jgi:uncharacterized membrane protein